MIARSTKILIGVCALALSLSIIVPATRGAGPRYFSTTKVTSGYCSYPWKLTGGGVASLPGDYFGTSSSTEYALTGSFPNGSGWRATATVTRGYYSSSSGWRFSTSSYTPRVYAICAS
jgi:hypothetical protein